MRSTPTIERHWPTLICSRDERVKSALQCNSPTRQARRVLRWR